MATTRRPLAGHVKWPFDEKTAYIIEKNFATLFRDMAISDPLAEVTEAPAGTFFRSNGSGAEWSVLILPNAATTGDLMYASAADTMAMLPDVATGNALLAGGVGVAPSWGKVNVTTTITGIVPIANGGTNNSSAYTAGSVIFSNGTSLTQDNSGLFFDSTNDRLGIGTASPSTALHLRSTGSTIITLEADSDNSVETDQPRIIFSQDGGLVTARIGFTSNSNELELRTDQAGSGGHGDILFAPNNTSRAVLYSGGGMSFLGTPSDPGAAIARFDGTVRITGLTTGSVLFAAANGAIAQDNANLFWDDTDNELGIGTNTPAAGVHVIKTYTADQAVGFYADIFHSTATAGTVYGGRYDATCSHTSGSMNATVGLINSARYRGTGTATANAMTGLQAFICLDDVASPLGTITTAQALNLSTISNFATGTPVVTITQARGMIIGDIGSGNGSNGLTISNSCAMSIAGSQTAATNSAVINISNTTSVPFAPTGIWCIFNGSTRDNHFAGPLFMGGTAAATGSNYILFTNGTALTGTPADTSGLYTADTVAGGSNLFAINEADVVSQLTGLDIRKTADESVANNTPQDDNHLLTDLPASSSYQFIFYGFATSPATAGILLQLDGTVGISTLKANINIYDSTGALVAFGRKTAFNSSTGVDFTGDAYFTITGVIEVSTAGTFRLEWAQNTTDAGNATVLQEDSYLTLRRLNA